MGGKFNQWGSSTADIITGTVFTGIFGTAAGVLVADHPMWAGFEAGMAMIAAGFTGFEAVQMARARKHNRREIH